MRSTLLLATSLLLFSSPTFALSSPELAAEGQIRARGVKRVTTVPAEYKATSSNKHVVSSGVKTPKMGTLRNSKQPSLDPTTRSLHPESHLQQVKRSLLALLVGGAVGDPNVSSSGSASKRSAMPVLGLPAEHEVDEREKRVKRGLVEMLVGGAVGDPNVAGAASGAGGREKRSEQKGEEKRWVWDSVIIQDGDTRTDLPPPGSNVNYFSHSNAAQTPAGTPPAPVLSDPFPPAPSPPVVQAARVSPPPSPSTTPEDHTTAKSRKMWNDPGVSKKGAHVVGAASPAPNPTTTTTPASAPRTPRVKAAIASPEFQILVAEEVEHDPHKFTRPSPTPLLAPLDKRVYRGPILQDGDSIGTDEVPIQGGGAETPTSTPEQPEITSVEVTGTASAQEAVETVTDQSVAGAFVDDLLEAIGEAVGLGEESSSNSAGTSSTSAVEKRAVHAHHQRGLTRQGHSPRLGLGAAPNSPQPKMRVKRVYKERKAFKERRSGVKSNE